MKNSIKKTAVSIVSAFILISATACGNEQQAPSETTLLPGETTAPTVDFSSYNFETMYGTQVINYLDHQYYFDGQAIPLAESNFYFIEALKDLSQMASYGMYPMTSEGWLDLSAEVNGEIPGAESGKVYATYGDFYVEYAEGMLENAYIVNALAAEDGLTLPDETVTIINDTISVDFANAAAQGGYTLDQYLQLFYGESCDEATMRDIMYRYKLADLYTTTYCENYEYDEEDIMVPNVRYALFYAPEGSTDEELAAQEALANELKDDSVDLEGNPDLDQFELHGVLSERQYQNGEDGCYQYGEIPVEAGQVVPAFEEWSYAEEREEGDIDVIYAPEYGYFVVGYLGLTEVSQSTKDQIAFTALSDYIKGIIDDNTYSFYGEGEFTTPDPVAPASTEPLTEESASESQTQGQTLDQSQLAPKKIDPKELVVTILAGIGGIAVVGGIVYGISRLIKKGADKTLEISESLSDEDEDEDLTAADGTGDLTDDDIIDNE